MSVDGLALIQRRPRWLASVLALAACLALPASVDAAAFQSWRSPRLGLLLEVPTAGITVKVDPAPPDATPRQIQETVLLMRGNVLLVRIDLFTGPPIDVQAWFDRDGAFALMPESRVQRTTAGRKGLPALRIANPETQQAPPQELAFVVLGTLRVRVTWEDAADAAAKPVFERVLQTLDASPVGAKEHRR